MDADNLDIHRSHTTQRQIEAPRESVYQAFSNPVLLAQWWGPKGFSNSFDEFDLTEGGHWRFTMHGPDGKNYPNENRFLVVEANVKVVLEHLAEPHFLLTITFVDKGDVTLVGWTQTFDTADHYGKIRHIVDEANEQNLDKLAALVESG